MGIDGKERSALLAAVDSTLPVEPGGEGADDSDRPDGVQVANAGAVNFIIRMIIGSSRKKDEPPFPLPPPLEPPQEPKDAPGNPRQEIPDPLPDRTETPVDPPNHDTTETLERDPVVSRLTILITPDGEELTEDEYLEKYPDHSGTLPQGTVVTMHDSKGRPTKLEIGGTHIKEQALLEKTLGEIKGRDVQLHDAIHDVMGNGGRLTTDENNERTSEITMASEGDPIQAATEAFDSLVIAAGGDPARVKPRNEKTNNVRVFEIEGKRISMNVRDFSGKEANGPPTVEIQVEIVGQRKVDAVKFRYGGLGE